MLEIRLAIGYNYSMKIALLLEGVGKIKRILMDTTSRYAYVPCVVSDPTGECLGEV
jgi:hypothetical protein